MQITITVLIDNNAPLGNPRLKGEHGLAYYIEVDDRVILFDTGQSDLLIKNATELNCKLDKVTDVVLSHGHYDHTGGLAFLAPILPKTTCVHFHPDVWLKRYSIKDPAQPKAIGIPDEASKALLLMKKEESRSARNIYGPINVTGEIPRHYFPEDVGGPFYLDARATQNDLILDDQALWFNTEEGLVIVFGCAHSGVLNTIRYCQELSKVKRIHALIGGFHLLNASAERLQATFSALKSLSPSCIAACHCTG